MANFWELEDGSGRWQLEDGTGNWLLETQVEAGASGGRVVKQVGVQLGQRIRRKRKLFVEGRLKLKTKSKSVGSLLINFKSKVEGTVKPLNLNSVSFGNIQLKLRAMSESKLKLLTEVEKLTRVVKIMALLVAMNSFDSVKSKRFLSFEFLESPEEWKNALTEADFRAFTGSSSFVGNVRFDRDTNGMRILLNDKPYNFCNVPERIFDSFEGAGSKGAFFNRIIKGQFDC